LRFDAYLRSEKLLVKIIYLYEKKIVNTFRFFRLIGLQIIAQNWGYKFTVICNDKNLFPKNFKDFLDEFDIKIVDKGEIGKLREFRAQFEVKPKSPKLEYKEFNFDLLKALIFYFNLSQKYQNLVLEQKLPPVGLPEEEIKKLEQSGFFVFFRREGIDSGGTRGGRWTFTTQHKKFSDFFDFKGSIELLNDISNKLKERHLKIDNQKRINYWRIITIFLEEFFKYNKIQHKKLIRGGFANPIQIDDQELFFKFVRNSRVPSLQRYIEILGQSFYFKKKRAQDKQFLGVFDGFLDVKRANHAFLLDLFFFDEIVPLKKFNAFLREKIGGK